MGREFVCSTSVCLKLKPSGGGLGWPWLPRVVCIDKGNSEKCPRLVTLQEKRTVSNETRPTETAINRLPHATP